MALVEAVAGLQFVSLALAFFIIDGNVFLQLRLYGFYKVQIADRRGGLQVGATVITNVQLGAGSIVAFCIVVRYQMGMPAGRTYLHGFRR